MPRLPTHTALRVALGHLRPAAMERAASTTAPPAAAAALEALTTKDEGGRGIAPLVAASGGGLAAAAAALASAKRVGIITGFPCLITEEGELRFESPQETDGPPGAVAIAKALLALGEDTQVTIMTDDINGSVVEACIAAMGEGRRPTMQCFPPRASLSESEWAERWASLLAPGEGFDHVVAIERAGPATNGCYYTMSMKDMTARLLSPSPHPHPTHTPHTRSLTASALCSR